MTCNLFILEQPETNSSVDYTIPVNDSISLNFSPEDIAGLNLGEGGSLVITLNNGSQISLANFQSYTQADNVLYLADGTIVDPSNLNAALNGNNANTESAPDSNLTIYVISQPADDVTREITLDTVGRYVLDLDLDNAQSASVEDDGSMVITFANNGVVVLNNYVEAMNGELPPELTITSAENIISGEDLIAALQLAQAAPSEELLEQAQEDTTARSSEETLIENQETADTIGEVAAIEPASGEEELAEIAQELAEVEPAAGEAAGGPSNSGYGFGSTVTGAPFDAPEDVGPINPTALSFSLPSFPDERLDELLIEPAVAAAVIDDNPVAGAPIVSLDETDITTPATGQVLVDFGNDGPGTITQNDSFDKSGSLAGGELTSGGTLVDVVATPTGYVGTAAGNPVFELVIDENTGEFTYTQIQPFDHADNTDPDDVITLEFGVNASDSDGDFVPTTITVNVADDAPTIGAQAEATADENDLSAGSVPVTGTFNFEFGEDGQGSVTPNGTVTPSGSLVGPELTSNGVDVIATPTSNGYEGKAGTTTVYTLEIDQITGDYTFTLLEPVDHADPTDPNDRITLDFGLDITDGDGDVVSTSLSINIDDSAPVINNDPVENIDETSLATDTTGGGISGFNPITEPGSIDANLAGDVTFSPDGNSSFSGSLLGGTLSNFDREITISPTASGYEGIDSEGNTIFTFTIEDPTTGDYTFTLNRPLDHADGTNPNDVITLEFGVIAEDSDGNTDTTTITVNIADDAIIARDDTNTVTESDIALGNVVLNDSVGVDEDYFITGISFNGNSLTLAPIEGETASIDGDFGTLVIRSDGNYTYTANSDNPDGVDTFIYTVTDGDGDSSTAELAITVTPIDDQPEITTPDLGRVDETDLATTNPLPVSGTVDVDFATDGPGTITANEIFTSEGSRLNDALTSNGNDVTITTSPTGYVGIADGEEIFTFEIDSDGNYTFELKGTLDHADPNDPNDIIQLNFGIQATDADNDVSTDTVVIQVLDDVPTIENSFGDVDETNLSNGDLTASNTVVTDFGLEVGSVSQNDTFTASAGGTAITLMANGSEVVVTASGDGYVGQVGGTEIFTLDIDSATGQFLYTQKAPFDHPDGSDDNDIIQLNFGVAVTSTDGDSDTATISIDVADDGPTAVQDINGAEEGQFITGDVLANDLKSQDLDNTVTSVTFGGTTTVIPAGGSETIIGTLGTLVMSSDGTYEFTATDIGDPDGTDVFSYTITDGDGDSDDSGSLSIRVTPDGEPVAVDTTLAVDETNLTPGPMIFTDDLNIDFGLDGEGTVMPNGNTSFGGSLLNDKLTSNGLDVSIITTPTGYAGTDGFTAVFTLELANDGTYTFTLFGRLDHADNTDPNDIITLSFGVDVTDSDGDVSTLTFDVNIHDDAPIAFDDDRVAQESQVIDGNVLENDESSEDRPTNVVSVTINGTTTDITADDTVINGDFGVLTISPDGSYSYAADSDNPNGSDVFTYTVQDFDGDQETAELTIDVSAIDDRPDVTDPAPITVDESDPEAVLTATGTVNADFGTDTPGEFCIDPDTSSFDSSTALLSGGEAVVLNVVDDTTITGTAGGIEVFRLEIDADTGAFTYTQSEPLDHPDTTDPDDVITLEFSVIAKDSDDDTTPATITINVSDDAVPTVAASNDVDETNIGTPNSTVSGTVDVDFGRDGAGEILPIEPISFDAKGSVNTGTLQHEGEDVVVTLSGDTYTGTAAGKTIFTLQLGTDGSYTFDLQDSIDHADKSDPNDIINLEFGIQAVDGDGDVTEGTLVINVADDGPSLPAAPVSFAAFAAFSISSTADVDETNLANESQEFSDTFNVDFGNDGPGTIDVDGNFVSSGSRLNDMLTSNGEEVEVTSSGSVYTGATAAGVTVFTFEVTDINAGDYTFTLFQPLDHADPDNIDDEISLSFGLVATDRDGDFVNGSVTVTVADDGPTAVQDINGAEEGQLITGDVLANDILSQDANHTVTSVTFAGTTTIIPAGGSETIIGSLGTLVMNSDGTYEFTATDIGDPDGTDTFSYTVTDGDGDSDDSGSLSIRVTPDGEPVAVDATLAVDETNLTPGPMIMPGTLNVDFGINGPGTITPSGVFTPSGSIAGGTLTSGGVLVDISATADGYVGTAGGEDIFTLVVDNDGNYTFTLTSRLDHADATDPNDAIAIEFGFTVTDGDGDATNVNLDIIIHDDAPVAIDDNNATEEGSLIAVTGEVLENDESSEDNPTNVVSVTINGTTTDITADDTDVVGAFGTLTISPDGTYSYLAADNTGGGVDVFTYTIQDFDGDQETAELTITVSGDDVPVVTDPDPVGVDEDDLPDNAMTTGTVTADFGADGPGEFCILTTGNNFDSSVPLLSGGLPITLDTVDTTTYVGSAGGAEVFRLVINTDGSYTFTQSAPLDHPDTSNPDDVITLEFAVVAKDIEGDETVGTITINVSDSGPVADDDTGSTEEGAAAISANVLDNDDSGADTPATVTAVTVNGVTTDILADDTVITGDFGTLTISPDGSYSYLADDNTGGGLDIFTYTLTDADGDTDTADLTITVGQDDVPVVTDPDPVGVDEDDLPDNSTTTGTVTADFGNDTPGEFCLDPDTGNFNSSTALTLGGVAVTLNVINDTTITGTAGGTEVFRLEIDADTGVFTYTQSEPLDHPDTSNPDDVITLEFSVIAKDSEGDETPGTITINVSDSGPVATDDDNIAEEGNAIPVEGNVLDNDDSGADAPATVTAVTVNGVTTDILADDTVITGDFGTLTISPDGSYSYLADDNTGGGLDIFTYTLTDADGDTDTADLTILIDEDSVPVVTDPDPVGVDEDDLPDNSTTTGTVTADFGNDTPGEFCLDPNTGNFNSSTALTLGGVAVTLNVINDTTITGTAGGTEVFRLEIDADTGVFTYTQSEPLDHPDTSNPDDVITLEFSVIAKDSEGDETPGTITINVSDSGPDAVNDSNSLNKDQTTASGNLLPNDDFGADGEGQILTTGVQTGSLGNLTINSDGSYTYTRTSSEAGTNTFNYTIQDADGDTDTATLTITQADLDEGNPDAVNDSNTLNKDQTTASGNILTNDSFGPDGEGGLVTTGTQIGSLGNLTINSDGSYTYTRTSSEAGTNTFNYTIQDADGDTDTATLTITQADLDEGNPDAVNDSNSLNKDQTTASGNILTNDSFGPDGEGGLVTTGTQIGSLGRVTINSDGSYTYTRTSSEAGTNTFNYTIQDADGDTDTATLTITQADLDEGNPDAVNDSNSLNKDQTTASGNILTNDSFGPDGEGGLVTTGVQTGSLGNLTINADGSYIYTRTSNAAGTNTFNYTITDFDGDTDTATLTITQADFDAGRPDARDDNRGPLNDGSSLSGNVLDNDDDGPDGGGFVKQVVFGGTVHTLASNNADKVISTSNGTLTISRDGEYSYTSKNIGGSDKTDTFTYTLSDVDGDTDNANLRITVRDNDGPSAGNDTGSLNKDQSLLSSNVRGNDSFGLDGAGSYVAKNFTGSLGNLSINSAGDYTYTRTSSSAGSNSFTYTIKDSDGDTDTATITITQADLDEGAPDAIDDTGLPITNDGSTATGNVRDNDVNSPDGGTFLSQIKFGNTVKNVSSSGTSINGSFGKLTIKQDGSYSYETKNIGGPTVSDTFTYTLRDVDGDTDTAILKLRVKDNDGPTAVDDRDTGLGNRETTEGGNIKSNDNAGLDGGGFISDIKRFGTDTYTTVTSSGVEVTGRFGTLNVKTNGSYTYTRTNFNRFGDDKFTYRISDKDGDLDVGVLTMVVPQFQQINDNGGDTDDGTPLVIDLDNDGIELTGLEDGVTFDIWADGDLDQVSWVKSDDGFLAIDHNNDGLINGHEELFGEIDTDGFNVLARYNTNGDGKIDSKDADWGKLKVWRDLNQDGVSQKGEVFTVNQLGITSISLAAAVTDFVVEDSFVPYTSIVTYEDGTESTIADVWLKYQETGILDETYGDEVFGRDTISEEALAGNPDDGSDDAPIVIGQVRKIYEDALDADGASLTDTVTVFYQGDGEGSVELTGGFSASGATENGVLSHKGNAINVAFDADGNLVGQAGDTTVFSLENNDQGEFAFTLFEALDHQEGADDINLNFDIAATDADGDRTEGQIRILVSDQTDGLYDAADSNEDDFFLSVVDEDVAADQFLFDVVADGAETLASFDVAEEEAIDMTRLIEDYDTLTDTLGDFVTTQDQDGELGASIQPVANNNQANASLQDVAGDIEELVSKDNIVA